VEADLQIGKEGWEKAVPEIRNRLKKRAELRIKIHQPLIEGRMRTFTQGVADQVAAQTGSKVVMVMGRTFVLRRVKK